MANTESRFSLRHGTKTPTGGYLPEVDNVDSYSDLLSYELGYDETNGILYFGEPTELTEGIGVNVIPLIYKDRVNNYYLPLTGGKLSGTLTLPRIILTSTSDTNVGQSSSPALIIGSKTGQHLEIDGNEIISKTNETEGGDLYINTGSANTYLRGSAIVLQSGKSYGSSLPSTGITG